MISIAKTIGNRPKTEVTGARYTYNFLTFDMIFVDKVRRYSQEQTLEEAVKRTIRECMEEDVMADFLKRNRAEVVKMCLYEYDEERQREFDREEGRDAERIAVARRMLKSHKLSFVEVAEIVGLTVEEVKALDTDEAVIEINGF